MNVKVKQKLDNELAYIHFTSKQSVLNKARKRSLMVRSAHFLNKEIEIPLLPATAGLLIFVAAISIYPFVAEKQGPSNINHFPVEGKVIEKGGSHYWEEWFSEVKMHES